MNTEEIFLKPIASHSVAIDRSPRREPWVHSEKGPKPRRGDRTRLSPNTLQQEHAEQTEMGHRGCFSVDSANSCSIRPAAAERKAVKKMNHEARGTHERIPRPPSSRVGQTSNLPYRGIGFRTSVLRSAISHLPSSMSPLSALWLTTLMLLSASVHCHAQSPVPDSFNPGADGPVWSFAVQPDGKILVGGDFWILGGQTRKYIGRLNANGTLDASFNPDGNGAVYSMSVQTDGKILVGGEFTTLGGQTRIYIGRLNADGSADTTFNPGANSGSWVAVYSLAVQADGKILVGGHFTSLGRLARNSIGRLNSDGTVDATFNPGANGDVNCLAVQADGKILVGGEFTTLGGQTRNYIARLNNNGTLDTTFNPGASDVVRSLAVQADGKILACGGFTTLGGQPRSYIGRLNSDGTIDGTFNPGANGSVDTMAVQADGKILVGGWFGFLAGQPRAYLGRLNGDGTIDASFNPGADWIVNSLAVQPDGKILAGGYYSSLGGEARNRIGRLNITHPATQSLSYDGATATWLRGGTIPEIWRATFDASTNGADWFSLGNGTRVSDGWQLSGLTVPISTAIRARGFVAGSDDGCGWYVEKVTGPPAVLNQPVSGTNAFGTTASFMVTAGGAPSLGYQWLKEGVGLNDGGNILGAQSSTLTLSNVSGYDAAGYSVVITNAEGSVTSLVATLTVHDPYITDQPLSQYVFKGSNADFSVTTLGTAPLSYQWRKDGVVLIGATNAMLTLTDIQKSDAGGYDVFVSNDSGSVTSQVASLTVLLVEFTADTFGAGINQFIMVFVTVGNAGNPDDAYSDADPGLSDGGVGYKYRMARYEVSQNMIDNATARGLSNVTAGAWTSDQPAADMNWYEIAAFVNWLNVTQGHHEAYDLVWNGSYWSISEWSSEDQAATGVSSGANPWRHKDAVYFLPSRDEWYKAAYHKNDGVTSNYWNYPTGSSITPDGIDFAGDPNYEAVFGQAIAPKSIYDTGEPGAYGTFGQGGNIQEWIETRIIPTIESHALKGGHYQSSATSLFSNGSTGTIDVQNSWEREWIGFRVASIVLPKLNVGLVSSNSVSIAWDADVTGFILQETTTLSPLSWANSPAGTNNPAVLPIDEGTKLFRLTRP